MTSRSSADEKIIDAILIREGRDKFTNRPADKGGPTKWGVTLRTLSKYRGKPVTIEDVKKLGEAEARDITYSVFIVEPGFHQITDEGLRGALVDFTYLFGADDSIPALQRIVDVFADGKLGPKTANRTNSIPARGVINQLSIERINLHARRVVEDLQARHWFDGTQAENLRGWLNRATAFIK